VFDLSPRCYLCTRPIDASLAAPHPLSLSIDHVKPLAMGGTNALENLRATHLGCNVEKGAS
jgi:5-methylcytosine-specific restriction endonuclease McrA